MKILIALALFLSAALPASAQSPLDDVALMMGIVDGARGSFRHTRRTGEGRFETLGRVLDSGGLGRLEGREPGDPALEVIGSSEVTALGECRYVVALRWLAPQERSEVKTVDFSNFSGTKVTSFGPFATIEFLGLDIEVKAGETGREREYRLKTLAPGFDLKLVPQVLQAVSHFRETACKGAQ